MDQSTLTAYLGRIGVSQPQTVSAATLRDLHRAHQTAVPFENLSIHLSEPISLAERDLLDKIVTRRRGGFCYELNGAFALLLEALGAQVTRVAARTTDREGQLGPPFDHLALIVRTADGAGPWLADVGFGGHSTYPLLFDRRDGQDDPGGRFVLADAPDGDVAVSKDGTLQYLLELREPRPGRFRPHLLVAADLARLPLHPRHHLLAAHRRRPGLPERPHPDPDQRRKADRAPARGRH